MLNRTHGVRYIYDNPRATRSCEKILPGEHGNLKFEGCAAMRDELVLTYNMCIVHLEGLYRRVYRTER
jgi:uncharacterized protein with HEPN domain